MKITKDQVIAYVVILASFYFAFGKNKKVRANPYYKKEKLKGGLADYVPDSVFDKKDLEKGIKVEMEHTTDREIAKEIAKDHLLEDPKYYDKLEKIQKNPTAPCIYELNVSFKRGRGPLQKRSLLTEAWSSAEAREKFQKQINQSLKNVVLESLQVRRVSC
jgi:hypothetical protein